MSIPFTISNLKDNPAINVKIQDLDIGQYHISFPEILKVAKQSPSQVLAVIFKDGKPITSEWKNAFANVFKDLGHVVEMPDRAVVLERPPVSVPMIISYRDVHGRRFESRFTILCSFTGGWSIKAAFDGIECMPENGPNRFRNILARAYHGFRSSQ